VKDSRKNLMALAILVGASTIHGFLPPGRFPAPREEPIPVSVGEEDDPNAQAELEFLTIRDPRTNSIPRGIRARELALARSLPRSGARVFRSAPGRTTTIQALTWTERGPNNVGGRTRAFAVDVTGSTTFLAGSVAGGIWKTTDDGASWTLQSDPGQIHGITCIAQDRRAGKTGIWYAGTGEIRGSTTNDTRWGSLYRGDGVFKSTDGGETWAVLPSTVSGTPQTSDSFDWVVNVATNPANAVQDEVLVATWNGIWRSTDGGGAWTQMLASDSGFTDVAVTSTGVMYAATRVAGQSRLWRSTSGSSWNQIQPGGWPATTNRVVIAPAPSNPNVVYFFVQGASNTPATNGHQLWKYTYVSGDGSGAGGAWANRGGSLPSGINTQAAYDMTIQVRPTDENFVIIGGTDLYRSTNGFDTQGATTTIGGYPFYPPHHPDLHAGVFTTGTNYYSAGDGGIHKTTNVTAANVSWTSLNNGYNVTQFYSVSIQPDAGTNRILAGAQDNGSQLGNASGASSWTQVFGGDGTVLELSPAADDRLYTQWQSGPLNRQPYAGGAETYMTPSGSTNALFVNPIALDPNNSSILYYAAGISATSSRIWRNDSAPIANNVVGWSNLPATDVGPSGGWVRKISALGVSTLGPAHTLYYGTTDGIVMKAVNAHTATPTVTNITPPGLNGGTAVGGFVRCIAVDPNDADRALLVFGNYNFPSIWLTQDGGATWTDVEGNLAGPGGPSVRWASLFYVGGQLQVFIGTSIGVLSTNWLVGSGTIWDLEAADEIGNVLVAYMDYRSSDHTLAVATHGRGVFTTQFFPTTAVDDPPVAGVVTLGPSFPNPARGSTTITFELPRSAQVSLRLFDVAGRVVQRVVEGPRERGRHSVRVSTDRLPRGSYVFELRAAGAVETRRLTVVR
jgi:hypothetical protein